MSSRSAVAVRASASATPPPSTSSSSGSTSWRSRLRVKRRSTLCGSCQALRPSSAHAAWVTLATHPQQRPAPGRVVGAHAGDRPRTRAAAQSEQHGFGLVVEGVRQQHRPVVTGVGQCAVAGVARRRLRAAVTARPATQSTCASTHPSCSACRWAVADTAAEPGCNPWSTISAVVGRIDAAIPVSANESGPPDSATHQRSAVPRCSVANAATAARSSATAPGRSIVAGIRSRSAGAGCPDWSRRC